MAAINPRGTYCSACSGGQVLYRLNKMLLIYDNTIENIYNKYIYNYLIIVYKRESNGRVASGSDSKILG